MKYKLILIILAFLLIFPLVSASNYMEVYPGAWNTGELVTVGYTGIKITTLSNSYNITNWTRKSGVSADTGYLMNSVHSVIENCTYSGDNCVLTTPITLSSSTSYYIVNNKSGGGSYNDMIGSNDLPYTGSKLIYSTWHNWNGDETLPYGPLDIATIGLSDVSASSSNLLLDNCSTYTNLVVNFTMYDEDNLTRLKTADGATYKLSATFIPDNVSLSASISNNATNSNYSAICSQLLPDKTYSLNLKIQYTATGYDTEFYNIQNYSFSASTMAQNISLYPLINQNVQEYTVSVKDANYIPLNNAIVRIDRQYLENGNFTTVEAPLTDTLGTTIAHFINNGTAYNIYIVQNGNILKNYSNIQLFCNNPPLCTLALQLDNGGGTPGNLSSVNNIAYTPYYNPTTRTYQVIWNSLNGNNLNFTLNGTYLDNYLNTSVCSNISTGSSNTTYCVIPVTYSNKTVLIQGYNAGILLFSDPISVSYNKFGSLTNTRYIIGGFLLIFFVLLAGSSGPLAIFFFLFGFIVDIMLYLVDTQSLIGAGSSLVWLIVAGGLLIWKMAKGGISNG